MNKGKHIQSQQQSFYKNYDALHEDHPANIYLLKVSNTNTT